MTGPELAQIPVGHLYVDPVNPRRGGAGDVSELATSIAGVGILNPLIVRVGKSPGRYGVLSGQRRFAAAKHLGLAVVPCMVHNPATDADALVIATAENVGRKAMNPIEDARSFRRILDDNPDMTQRQLGDRLGVSEFTVSTRLQLLQLPKAEQDAVADGRLSASRAYLMIKKSRPQTARNAPRTARRRGPAVSPQPTPDEGPPAPRRWPAGTTPVAIPNDVIGAVRIAASRSGVPVVAWVARALADQARRSAA